MNKCTTIITTVLISIGLSACSEKTQTVKWYKEHKDVLTKEIEKCKTKNPEQILKDKHCIVIMKAQQEVFEDHQINAPLPSIQFK